MTIPVAELRKKWKKDPDFQKEYEALKPEFKLARELIEARAKAGLSQSDVAERMGTSQPTVARLESGHKLTLKTLERYAEAVGMKVEINLVVVDQRKIEGRTGAARKGRSRRPAWVVD